MTKYSFCLLCDSADKIVIFIFVYKFPEYADITLKCTTITNFYTLNTPSKCGFDPSKEVAIYFFYMTICSRQYTLFWITVLYIYQ